ncbi:MAG: dihydroorotate dehydrogenase electron transfer subunit [Eubacteriales bacterium]|nr:dihydroorotate dehydrogenase electron transfer subunit [Eubacteriales bacterium]
MSRILCNKDLGEGFFLLKAEQENDARMGQFYMLRAWEHYPVLSRPISVYDADGQTVSFLYKVVGQGTEIFSKCKAGEEITLEGPHGNGFPELSGKRKIALVGGGVGIAPLYLAAKTYKKETADCSVDIYLGFSGKPILTEEFQQTCDRLVVNVGGFVTDDIDPLAYDAIVTCGPTVMMKVLYEKCRKLKAEASLYVSMENRMACGIGACLVCSCRTAGGNRKVCKDGPVFLGSEVFGVE